MRKNVFNALGAFSLENKLFHANQVQFIQLWSRALYLHKINFINYKGKIKKTFSYIYIS